MKPVIGYGSRLNGQRTFPPLSLTFGASSRLCASGRARRRWARGFTLIELLVVVVILAVLAAIVVPRVVNRIADAKIAGAIADIKNFTTALSLYNADTGQYPTSDQGLEALLHPPNNKTYIENMSSIPPDPWGHPYVYKSPGDEGRDYDIVSAGPDGQFGTADDIQSWNLKQQR